MTALSNPEHFEKAGTKIDDISPALIEDSAAKTTEEQATERQNSALKIPADVLSNLITIVNFDSFSDAEVIVNMA